MKRILVLLLVLVSIISITLAGCGTSSNNNEVIKSTGTSVTTVNSTAATTLATDPIKVTMVNYNNEDAVKELLALIKTKLPDVVLEYQFVDLKQYSNIVETQLAAGEGADIIGSSPVITEKHAKLGYIADLSKYASLYSESGTSVYTFDGKLYAIPGMSWFEGMFYNKDIFVKYGLTPPKTFDELLKLHETLKKAGVKPQAMGAKSWEPLMKSSMGFVMSDYLFTDAGKGFDSAYKAGTKTLDGNWNASMEKWAQLIKLGYLNKEMLGVDYDQALDEFATGKAAMWESGPWSVATIKQKNPNLQFDMFPFYGNTPGPGYLIGGPGIGYELNANSKVKDAAFKILDLISTVEGQQAYAKTNEGSSSFLNGVDIPMPAEFSGCSETFKAGNVYCPWNVWGGNVGSVQEDYGKYMQEVLGGKKTITEALKAIDIKSAELRSKK